MLKNGKLDVVVKDKGGKLGGSDIDLNFLKFLLEIAGNPNIPELQKSFIESKVLSRF